MTKLSPCQANYLATLYQLEQSKTTTVFSSEIAAAMGVTKATMCRATDALEQKGLLQKQRPQKGLLLTEKGRALASDHLERQQIIARFLLHTLHIDEAVAQADASAIAHSLSEKTFQSMRLFLGS